MPDISTLTGWQLVAVVVVLLVRDELRARRTVAELRDHRDRMERATLVVRRGDTSPGDVAQAMRRRRADDDPR